CCFGRPWAALSLPRLERTTEPASRWRPSRLGGGRSVPGMPVVRRAELVPDAARLRPAHRKRCALALGARRALLRLLLRPLPDQQRVVAMHLSPRFAAQSC